MFFVVDKDNYPQWIKPVSGAEADEWIARGDAAYKLPAHAFTLTWASRWGLPSRWYLFPV